MDSPGHLRPDSNANFIAPFILDPNNPNTMLAGGQSLWRSTNVKAPTPSWTAIHPSGSSNISAIAVALGDSDTIWIGQNNGEIYSTSSGTSPNPSWSALDDNGETNPLPDRYVQRILIDPYDEEVAYVALGGFSPDNLWMTNDGGNSWSDASGTGATALSMPQILPSSSALGDHTRVTPLTSTATTS